MSNKTNCQAGLCLEELNTRRYPRHVGPGIKVVPLRLVFAEPALVHWGIDDWQQPRDTATVRGMLGLHVADLASESLAAGQLLVFSIQDSVTGTWFAHDCVIKVVPEAVMAQGMPAPAAGSQVDREAAD